MLQTETKVQWVAVSEVPAGTLRQALGDNVVEQIGLVVVVSPNHGGG
jgi:hypothetical protein